MRKLFFLQTFFLFACCGIFISAAAQSSLPPAYHIISDTAIYITLPDSNWQIMPDAGGKLNLPQVINATNFQSTNKRVNYKIKAYWQRFRLVNNMPQEVNIALPEISARADLYAEMDNEWKQAQTGDMLRWSLRDGLKKIPAFTLSIPAGKSLTIYKRIRWDYVSFQPDSMAIDIGFAAKIIQEQYINDTTGFMTSMQDAFVLGLMILSFIISFYFFLVVREKEFLYFSLFLLLGALQSIPTLHDVFLREHPYFLLYLYIICNSLVGFALIHSLRYFLKTFKRFPAWDKILIVFSILQVVCLLSSHFVSAVFQTNLSAPSHFVYNLFMLMSAVVVLITLFLYVRHHDKAVKLMIIAFTPIMLLTIIAYLEFLIYGLYAARLGEPAVPGYATAFNKAAFFIMIVVYLWMMGFFNWVLFLRFSNIRKELFQQTTLDNLKSRFFANISHEFRTPLTLIMGPVEDYLKDGDEKKFRHILPELHRNSKRLLQLINQLLDLSRLDVGSYQVYTTQQDIIPFVKQIVHSFSSMADRKNIQLEAEVDPRLKNDLRNEVISFYFDDDIVEKILYNLLSNAFKFTPDGGNIIVSIGLSKQEKNFLELKVEDNGAGIPLEKLPFIFNRFYQADNSSNRQYEGSGIGLALVKELVTLHGGKITAVSEMRKGTSFSCYFPLNKKIISNDGIDKILPGNNFVAAAEDNDEKENNSANKNGAPVVLIVEDQKDVRKYIREKLNDIYLVEEAKNGQEGLAVAIEKIPDLVISDVMMPVPTPARKTHSGGDHPGGPEMDGFELCKLLKTDDRTSHIPVILLTARAEDKDKISGLETGADAYLIKPFNAQELRIRVNNLIQVRSKMRAKFSSKLVVKPSEIAVTPQDRLFIQKLLSTTESHVSDEHFSVEQLAGAVNMSRSQINRKLKAIINQSALQFIRSVRMQRAQELLKNKSASVAEIAYQAGFSDPGYFAKVFKNYFGYVPSEGNEE